MSYPDRHKRARRRIGIVGYYGVGNLGDETVVAVLLDRLRKSYPAADFYGICLNPADTERRHAIKALPIGLEAADRPVHSGASVPASVPAVDAKPPVRGKLVQFVKRLPFVGSSLRLIKHWCYETPYQYLRKAAFLYRSYRRLQGFDLLVVPGSGPLTDWWGGPWKHPFSMVSWTVLAKLSGAEVYALSIGSERLSTRLGKRFCKWFLSMVDYRSFRDRYSRDTMLALGLKGPTPIYPDQGFGYSVDSNATQPAGSPEPGRREAPQLTIGVTPVARSYCVPGGADDSAYYRYLETLSAFLSWLIQRGCRIAFCNTDVKTDLPFVQAIVERIAKAPPREDVAELIDRGSILTTDDLIARMDECDIVIASKFHGVVLPFVLEKPVLAVSYGRKIGDLMNEVGLGEYHRAMDKVSLDDLIAVYLKLEEHRYAIAHHLRSVVADYRVSLEEQYRKLFGHLAETADVLAEAR